MATAQQVNSLATLLLGGLDSLQLNPAASGRLEEAAKQLGDDLRALASSQHARGLRQAASQCRQLVAACTKLEDRMRSKLRRGPPAAAADARTWAASIQQYTTAACHVMEAVLGAFHTPGRSGLLDPAPAARAVAALMRCGTRALESFCRLGLGQPERAEEASAAGAYLAHGVAAQIRAVTMALLATVSNARWRTAADSSMLVPAALRSWMASVARGGHACLAAADPSDGHVRHLLVDALPTFLGIVALHRPEMSDQMHAWISDPALMWQLGHLLAAGHALLVDEAQPTDYGWIDHYRSACLFTVGLPGTVEELAPLLGAALPMREPAVQLLSHLPMVPPVEAVPGTYCQVPVTAVWLLSALTEFHLTVLQPGTQADMRSWSAEAQAAAAEAASGGDVAEQQALAAWLRVVPAAAQFFEALLPGQPLAADADVDAARLGPGLYVLCLLRFGEACEAAAAYFGALQSACTAGDDACLNTAVAAEALLRLAPKLPRLLSSLGATCFEAAQGAVTQGLHPIVVVMRQTLSLACNMLAGIRGTVHDGAPGPVRQALRHVHASACKVPHALGQLPRQLRAAAGVLCNPASHAAGPIALRLDLTVLAQAAACVSFGKGTLRRVYAEPAGAEGDEAAGSRRRLTGMALQAGPALLVYSAMPQDPSGATPLDIITGSLEDVLGCLPSPATCGVVLLGWRQQSRQLEEAGLAVPAAVAALLAEAEAAMAGQGHSLDTESTRAELESALGLLRCANLRCPNVAGCSEAGQQSKKCARCRSVSYCGVTCQRIDYPRHKLACHPA